MLISSCKVLLYIVYIEIISMYVISLKLVFARIVIRTHLHSAFSKYMFITSLTNSSNTIVCTIQIQMDGLVVYLGLNPLPVTRNFSRY